MRATLHIVPSSHSNAVCFNAVPLCPILLSPQPAEPVCVYHSSVVVTAAMTLIIPRPHPTRRHPHCRPRPHGSKVTSPHSLSPPCQSTLGSTCTSCPHHARVVEPKVGLRPSPQVLLRGEVVSVIVWSNTTGGGGGANESQ